MYYFLLHYFTFSWIIMLWEDGWCTRNCLVVAITFHGTALLMCRVPEADCTSMLSFVVIIMSCAITQLKWTFTCSWTLNGSSSIRHWGWNNAFGVGGKSWRFLIIPLASWDDGVCCSRTSPQPLNSKVWPPPKAIVHPPWLKVTCTHLD